MPINGQCGFIFLNNVSAEGVARVAAHELGHGVFRLYHTFSSDNRYILPEGTTDNLMDYNGGTALYKYQWDYIHDPQTMLFAWAEEEEEGAIGGSWTILDKKHTLLFNHVYDNNNALNLKYNSKIANVLAVNPNEESLDLEYSGGEKEWINQWKLRTASSDQILEKIIKKIQKAEKGKKIEKMTLKAKGIYIGKYSLDDVEYPIAVYSEKEIIDNIIKVQVNEVSQLDKEENRKHLRAEETFIKYLVIAFYEEGSNEPVLMMQIEKFDISKLQNTKEKWLEFLEVLQERNIVKDKDKEKSNFDKYQNKIFDHEGGFVDDPVDLGGATNKGITFNTFKAYAEEDLGIEPTLENLKKLTNDQAAIIYKKRYWDVIHADEIKNGSIAYSLYDFFVNAGYNAIKEMQQALLELGYKITVDGIIGEETIKAINNVDSRKLFDKFKEKRLNYYKNLVNISVENYKNIHPDATEEELLKSTQKKFEKGWINRVNSIEFEE